MRGPICFCRTYVVLDLNSVFLILSGSNPLNGEHGPKDKFLIVAATLLVASTLIVAEGLGPSLE